MSEIKISVFGLGKLGASMLAGFASRGFKVIGTDINEQAVIAVNKFEAPVQETGLGQMIYDNKDRISATTSVEEAILNSNISFIIVPTPSDNRGAFSIDYAKKAFKDIGRVLKNKSEYHTIVLTSTVLPGATRYGLLPILEKESGKKCGEDFGLCYNPEFIALGSVIRDFLNPDFYLLGQYDKRSGDCLEAVHNKVSLNNAPVMRMSLENAELAKIAVNSFVTLKISFANMLSEFCENIPGGDIDVVSDALGKDKRIGRKYLTGGLGFGGPCFPRDNVALNFMGKTLGVDSSILEENDNYNKRHTALLIKKIKPYISQASSIGVLGLAYKPFSHVVEESPGIAICKALAEEGCCVIGHDPLAIDSASIVLQNKVTFIQNLSDVIKNCDVLIFTTTDPIYRDLIASADFPSPHIKAIIDPWRMVPNNKKSSTKIISFGQGDYVYDEILNQTWSAIKTK